MDLVERVQLGGLCDGLGALLRHPRGGRTSAGTITNRFDAIGVEVRAAEDTRGDDRELLFRSKGITSFRLCVILFNERHH